MRKDDTQGLPIYESHPPEWLPKAHTSADLGYPGFYPPRPGQDEDVLTNVNVKGGFQLGQQVTAETFSAQSMINADLHSSMTLARLEALMNEVFIRRADRIPLIPPSTFRIPTRVTLNDAKRQAWFADLANPDVPLHKLGKSVPHGAKGHDLLDLLQSNNVEISRAVWFLRVFGANETAGLRNKPTYNPVQYSVDWANVVTGYMKKQLTDIALPSAPRPGLNIKQTFKGVLSDGETREKWINRFTYCLKLLRTFYSEGLVDNRTFLIWIVQQMGSCNLAQAGFITRLADEYLDGMVGSRALTRPFIEACLCKLNEICSTSAYEFLSHTESLLKTLLQRLCIAIPDSFVSPRMWTTYSILLSKVLTENMMDRTNDQHIDQNSRDIQQLIFDNFLDIKRRNEAMLFYSLPTRVSARLGTAVSDVRLLNSISSKTDLNNLPFFVNSSDDQTGFIERLDMLLTWCVTPLQYGDHRPFAAVTLIRNWRDHAGERATRRDFTPPDEFLQDQLFEWLDSSEVAGEPENIRSVSLLFGKLVKHEIFSYASYIQRLIARGEPGLSYSETNESRHRRFLRWIPLFKSTSSLTNQRKVTLYGARVRETPEDVTEREIRREIRAVLPDIFSGDVETVESSTSNLLKSCNSMISASRFEQVRTFRQWLLPILQKHIAEQKPGTKNHPALLKSYCVSVELMTHASCFLSILDLTLCLLEHSTTVDLLMAVIDTLHRFATIWACMNAIGDIITALDTAHQVWKVRGVQSRPLLSLLLELDDGRHLTDTSRKNITADITAFTLALQPVTERHDVVPDVLPEILLLAGDPDNDSPTLLANSLWIKYRTSFDWAWKVWDNTVASLRQVPVMASDIISRRACALRYGVFLWHVDQHLATGLDGEVLRWFLGPGRNEVAALSTDAWDVLAVVLLYLSVHGALKTTTILRGLVYPAWKLTATTSSDQQNGNADTFLRAANNLCRRLLLSNDINDDGLPPTDLHDVQCIRTRRQDVYCAPHFQLLVSSVPLLICVENNASVLEDLRSETEALRFSLCQDRDFRQGAYRNLDATREAFEEALQNLDESSAHLSKHIVSGLRMLMCDTSDDVESSGWPDVTSLLSPWKIASTMIQLQLILRQMDRDLLNESTHQNTSEKLDKLILMLFHHSMTSEEAYYVGEMARGVDNAVAGKFINNGLKCITELLQDPSETIALPERFRRAGELLRVLIYVSQPMRDDMVLLPNLDPQIQEEFLDSLQMKVATVESLLTLNEASVEDPTQPTQGIILILRLLQFELGFHSTWTPKTKELCDNICKLLFRLSLVYGTSNSLDPVTFPLIIDTLYYLYDEIPSDVKVVPFDPFRNYPNLPISELPPDLPTEYRTQLISLLPHLPAAASVLNLVTTHRDSNGNLIYGSPVVNRPWEWIENLGEPSNPDTREGREREDKDKLHTKHIVKNSASLSLESFGARMTGDGNLPSMSELSPRIEGNIRAFEDGLSAENIFKRDWRETRVELEPELLNGNPMTRLKGEVDQEGSGSTMLSAGARSERRPTPRGSPASSAVSRSSARGSATSMRQSPGQPLVHKQSNSSIGDPIDVDSIPTSSSSKRPPTKRKATALSISDDDEVEIVDGPHPMRPTASKKPKVKATATKTKAKKR